MKQNKKVPTLIWKMSILDRAIKQWGIDAQLDMLVEESSELILAVQHMKRKRCGWEKVAEEIADVKIMSEQISLVIGEEKVDEYYNQKLERLEKRLNAK